MQILVTGGAGYIGSHTLVELLEVGHDVIVVDNLCNGSIQAIKHAERLTSRKIAFYQGDIRDRAFLDDVFQNNDIEAVIHFAGLKAVGESVHKPLTYYQNNVYGTTVLCEAMAASNVYKLVFSSSATVYGEEAPVPYVESMPRGRTTNPYGASKSMVEQVLTDLCNADECWSVVLLRYFNPIGAHPSGMLGENPLGIPNNLMPFISQVAVGRLPELAIFGNDYPTRDGTCVRDYLHVVDLARGHLKALHALDEIGIHTFNLGTGQGYSVLEIVKTFEQVTGQLVPYRFAQRRAGDLAAFWADPGKAERELGWHASLGLEAMVADTWRWQSCNPYGFCAEIPVDVRAKADK